MYITIYIDQTHSNPSRTMETIELADILEPATDDELPDLTDELEDDDDTAVSCLVPREQLVVAEKRIESLAAQRDDAVGRNVNLLAQNAELRKRLLALDYDDTSGLNCLLSKTGVW
jgi:hypothetical protein